MSDHSHPHDEPAVPAPPRPSHFVITLHQRTTPTDHLDRTIPRASQYGYDNGVFHWLEGTGEVHFVLVSDYAEITVEPQHERLAAPHG